VIPLFTVTIGRANITPLVVLALQGLAVGAALYVGRRLLPLLKRRLSRPAQTAGRVIAPTLRNPVLLLAVALILPLVELLTGGYLLSVTYGIELFVMLAIGLNIVVGYTGLLDLGYVAFYAVGAYTFALLGSSQLADLVHHTIYFLVPAGTSPGLHISMWLVMPLAGLLAAAFGVLIGFPTLRLRGDYLAIVTLGFGEITRIFANNLDEPVNITNGPRGVYDVDPIWLGNYSFGVTHHLGGFTIPSFLNYYYLLIVLILITVFFVSRLATSRVGRAWAAIREDELAAEAGGINTRNLKLLAYASGGFFGGVAGAVFAAGQHFIDPGSFGFFFSILVVCMVVVGGMGSIAGVVVGTVLTGGLYFLTSQFGSFRVLIFGILLVVVIVVRPEGLLPSRQRQLELERVEAPPDAPPPLPATAPGTGS
jgi:branched-chain amino acid transport system permease protein